MRKIVLPCLIVFALSRCATYREQPLGTRSTLPDHVPDLLIDPQQMPLPELANHRFDPSDGLDMTEVAMLAVVNNPDLKIARASAGVSHAQAFAAGLLPDPRLSASADRPDPGQSATTLAYNFGLSYDVIGLLTRAPRYAAARQDARKTDLTVLWQEWQVVAMSRQLFTRLTEQQQLMDALQQTRALFADRYDRTEAALQRGLLTLDAVTPHLVALQDVNRQINDLERLMSQSRHDLSDLLGVSPDAHIPLVGTVAIQELDETALAKVLVDLPRRRPDLVALQAGYAAEEQRYRAAILAQFPMLSIGFDRARDATNVRQAGLSVSLSLPIFNRNRGAIAVERATRQQLHEEYQQRLNTANSGIHRILAEQRINRQQLRDVDLALANLSSAVEKSNAAFKARNIDALASANLQASLLAKRVERIGLEQSILEQNIALQTLVGGELPVRLVQ
ncbi:MAG: outer rane efflux family protein [Gemmatimonadetes bacterium]|nr:outer rane efflux family protein [Gemmatimonadota bacterium]